MFNIYYYYYYLNTYVLQKKYFWGSLLIIFDQIAAHFIYFLRFCVKKLNDVKLAEYEDNYGKDQTAKNISLHRSNHFLKLCLVN